MSTIIEVQQVTTALAEFDKVAAGLSALEKAYKGVLYPVATKEGMKAAVAARRAIREPRLAVEACRVNAKRPLLDLGKKLDSEAKRITAALTELEDPIQLQIKTEEDRLHNEAVAHAAAETARVEALEARLDAIRTMPYEANGLAIDDIKAILVDAKSLSVGDDWQEFKEKAASAKLATVAALEGVLAKAEAAEIERLRIQAEREELEHLRRAQYEREEAARAIAEQQMQEARARIKEAQDKLDAERQRFAQEQEAARQAKQKMIDAQLHAQDVAAQEPEIELIPEDVEPPPVVVNTSRERPTDNEIIHVLMTHFHAERVFIEEWIADMAIRRRGDWQ